jgi:putative hydrolase of the HAD superfamily
VKPHPTIFQAALGQLGVEARDGVMVGDSLEEDIEGARALGMRAILIDRNERHPDVEERLTDLYGLPAALGLNRPG